MVRKENSAGSCDLLFSSLAPLLALLLREQGQSRLKDSTSRLGIWD